MGKSKNRSWLGKLLLQSGPPLNWYALLTDDDRSDWAAIHRFHALQTWNHAVGAREKIKLLLAVASWPIAAIAQARRYVGKVGDAVQRQTGITRKQQFSEQARLAVFECIAPKAYYMFRLYEPANRARAHRYLHRYESKNPAPLFRVISEDSRRTSRLLCDKLAFHDECVAIGIATPRVHLVLEEGEVSLESRHARLPAEDLFIKPRNGRGGTGTQAWRFTALGDYEDADGQRIAGAELLDQLRNVSKQQTLLVQERMVNHPDLDRFCGSAFSTARIMTIFNESDRPEPVAAVFRMATGNAIVDNIHRGGIAARVDLKTGVLGSAIALNAAALRTEIHPETQRRFSGRTLPDWQAALDLVVAAHRHFAGRCVVGWDVGFTNDGPVLVEGNSSPCVHLLQRGMGEPLGDARFGQLLAYQLRER